ncbi:MAG: outer membrane beta-barrel protein [Bacteroidia bacterium]|nr:outer membrane beta-barrel protein [Bacteroidia bacterium]
MMNLNLKNNREFNGLIIKGLVVLYILFSLPYKGFGQNKSTLSVGFSLAPVFGGAINRSDNYDHYIDSVKSTQGLRATIGAHIWANYALLKTVDVQIGLGYMETGFSRRQTGLNFGNPTYPGIATGRIEDNSNTKKAITYNYKFQYIQVPILFNFYLKRSGNFKWIYSFTAGITTNVLVKHQIQANMDPGYSIEGKTTYKIDSTGFDARRIAVNLLVGAKIEYRNNKKSVYFIQPAVGIYPISVSSAPNKSHPWFVMFNVGMLYDLF